MTLPEFIGLGPGRTGTTWLHRVLEGRVNLPYGVKETQFFSTFYNKGIGWYAYHFRYADAHRKTAEICPYFADPLARDRIKEYLPGCRFILTFRDPVERAYSAYKLMRRYVWARGSFEEVFANRPHLVRGNRYASLLRGWFEKFGRENFLVTLYDDLRAEPQPYLDRVCGFMGIEPIALMDGARAGGDVNAYQRSPRNRRLAQNARHVLYWLRGRQAYGTINLLERAGMWEFCFGRGDEFPPLSPEIDARMRQFFLPEIEALELLINRDLSAWKSTPACSPPLRMSGASPAAGP